jgi:outer membrane protein TolC
MYVANTAETARTQRQQLDFAVRNLDISERTIAGARAVLTEMEAEHAAGRKSQADVDQAKLAVANAEAGILPARADYLMKWTEFVSLVGADPAMNYLPGRYAR